MLKNLVALNDRSESPNACVFGSEKTTCLNSWSQSQKFSKQACDKRRVIPKNRAYVTVLAAAAAVVA